MHVLGLKPHRPGRQRPFLSQAGDFIMHSRTVGNTGEKPLPLVPDNSGKVDDREGAGPDLARNG